MRGGSLEAMSWKKLFSDFKPAQEGLSKVLGPLEAAVMDIIWRQERVSVRDVYERLKLDREIAYTTVMTIMSRLAEKDLLKREKVGAAYHYSPAISREDFTKAMVRVVLDGLLEDYADVALAHFVTIIGDDSKDAEKIAELEEIIRGRKGKGE